MTLITLQELQKHNSKDDCWVALHGKVYNLTQFLNKHPGGAKVIMREAGKDGTEAFSAIHPPDIIARVLPSHFLVGNLDPNAIQTKQTAIQKQVEKPPLGAILNSFDFENVAKKVLKPEAWAYYSSGSDDEITLRENREAFNRIWLRPRVMVSVFKVNTQTKLLGTDTAAPFYISATALGKLGHPEGEVVLTRACGSRNIIQMMPTLASCSMDEMMNAALPNQKQWYQVYVNQDRKITQKLIQHAEKRGAAAIVITVDAPALGRREKDMRMKFVDDAPDVQDNESMNRSQGAARAISSFIDPNLCWNDISWFKSITRLPIVLKGIQTGEDALLAAQHGVQGIIVSNHGGRQLDTVRSGIEILPEVIECLTSAGLRQKLSVFVDGGFRRGGDIYKALALGADAVGLGRPTLYALSSYGQAGVEHCLDLLKEELEMVMRLMGTPEIKEIGPNRNLVITKDLSTHVGQPPTDHLSSGSYEKLEPVKPKL